MWLVDSLKFWWQQNQSVDEEDCDPVSIAKALAELEPTVEDKDSENDDPSLDDSISVGVKYQEREGIITNITENSIIIDCRYYYELNGVNEEYKVGQRIGFSCLDFGGHKEVKVCKIYCLEDAWGDIKEDLDEKSVVLKEGIGVNVMKLAEILNKEGSTLRLRMDNSDIIDVDMDKLSMEFLPMKGDWLSCTAICAFNERSPNFTGDILSFEKVGPVRNKVCLGEITVWQENISSGIISNEIFFTLSVCSSGYIPRNNDTVTCQCIESTQGTLTWRAINVSPTDNKKEEFVKNTRSEGQGALYQPKEGVSLKLTSNNCTVKLGATLKIEVKLQNDGEETQVLTQYKMRSYGSQCQIKPTGPRMPYQLRPNSMLTFTLVATGRFIGKTSESLVLSFGEKFHLGCLINLTVDDDLVENLKKSSDQSKPRKGYTGSLLPTKSCFMVPGVKPVKPVPFIPVQSPAFNIPHRLFDVVLGDWEKVRSMADAEYELEQKFPQVIEPLSRENYGIKFHTLLHLEELQNIIAMKRYYQDRAVFRPKGEYLILDMPGLSESRPSIIIGDKALVSDPKDEKREFEGIVHKVHFNEVWLKFNSSFYSLYSQYSFKVKFKSSRTSYIRCHQAIHNIYDKNHLGFDWLFPNNLKNLKSPQVIIREEANPAEVVGNGTQSSEDSTSNEINGTNDAANLTPNGTGESNGSSDVTKKSPSRLEMMARLLPPEKLEKISLNHGAFLSSPVTNSNGETPNITATNSKEDNSPPANDTNNSISNGSLQRNANQRSSLDSVTMAHNYSLRRHREQKINWSSSGRGYGDSSAKSNTIKVCQVTTHNEIKWFNGSLNKRQREVVINVLKGEVRPLPYIIFGPPGTGKTVTLVETILQILYLIPDSRLLIATPSNSAADLITDRILASLGLLPGELVRLVSYTYLHDKRMPPHLIPYCALADMSDMSDKTDVHDTGVGLAKICSRESLGRHRITVGTCNSLGMLYTLGFPVGHFTHVFVDEAGQATEPEILIPLSFLHKENGQAILAGDPMQLGPVIMSRLANSLGLGHSLLYRFLLRYPYARDIDRFPATGGYDPRLITRLVENYRSVSEILHLPSKLFYDSELIANVSVENSFEGQILQKMAVELDYSSEYCPAIIFHGVKGENFQEGDSPSWYNPQELVQVISYYKAALKIGLKEDHVGVVTPYQKQATKIRQMISEMNLPAPKVGSVEEFQGQERYVIIVSAVRSKDEYLHQDLEHTLGFLRSPFRVNVTISRARALLIIIGDPSLLGHDHYWRSVIHYAIKIGGYTGCSYPMYLLRDPTDESGFSS